MIEAKLTGFRLFQRQTRPMVNVLVAEKSTAAREAIVEALARIDAIAVQGVVPDLRGAVRSLCGQAPDLVITGIELADASGIDLIEAARQLAPASRVVVVGASPTSEAWRRQLATGSVQFIEAEPDLTALSDLVAELACPETEADRDDELRLLGRITAGVAHDLSNYLGAMHAVFALLETAPGDAGLRTRLGGAIDQALRLTRSLVGHVRGESPRLGPVDLGAIVDRTMALIAPMISTSITVRVDIASPLPMVRGAAVELEQLVLNLVLNAADAMPGGGELAVRVQPTGIAAVYLEVADTGIGIPPEALVTSGGRTASAKSGQRTGLGLGIVRRVVDHHGGSIRFAPRLDRSGSIVWALLPTD
jgi:signal transduction histidine kinase